MAEVAELTKTLQDVFKDIWGTSVPLPPFHGKKGEKPEGHCLKIEDFFKDLKITGENEKEKFKASLCGKTHQWLEDLTPKPAKYSVDDTAPIADREVTMKHKFIERWSTKGRNPEALYSEWQNLKFDPASDDIKEFISDVKNLAKRLGYLLQPR